MMERASWTDARLDDFVRNVDRRFDLVDQRFDRVDQEIRELRGILVGVGGGMMVGLVGVIAAILARGV